MFKCSVSEYFKLVMSMRALCTDKHVSERKKWRPFLNSASLSKERVSWRILEISNFKSLSIKWKLVAWWYWIFLRRHTSLKKTWVLYSFAITARDFPIPDGPKIENPEWPLGGDVKFDWSIPMAFKGRAPCRYQMTRNCRKATFEPKSIGFDVSVSMPLFSSLKISQLFWPDFPKRMTGKISAYTRRHTVLKVFPISIVCGVSFRIKRLWSKWLQKTNKEFYSIILNTRYFQCLDSCEKNLVPFYVSFG